MNTNKVNENPEKYMMPIKVISRKEASRIYPKKRKMNKIKELEKQIIKERKELHKLDGMDWFIKAAHIHGLYMSIVLHSISQPSPNLVTPKEKK